MPRLLLKKPFEWAQWEKMTAIELNGKLSSSPLLTQLWRHSWMYLEVSIAIVWYSLNPFTSDLKRCLYEYMYVCVRVSACVFLCVWGMTNALFVAISDFRLIGGMNNPFSLVLVNLNLWHWQKNVWHNFFTFQFTIYDN